MMVDRTKNSFSGFQVHVLLMGIYDDLCDLVPPGTAHLTPSVIPWERHEDDRRSVLERWEIQECRPAAFEIGILLHHSSRHRANEVHELVYAHGKQLPSDGLLVVVACVSVANQRKFGLDVLDWMKRNTDMGALQSRPAVQRGGHLQPKFRRALFLYGDGELPTNHIHAKTPEVVIRAPRADAHHLWAVITALPQAFSLATATEVPTVFLPSVLA